MGWNIVYVWAAPALSSMKVSFSTIPSSQTPEASHRHSCTAVGFSSPSRVLQCSLETPCAVLLFSLAWNSWTQRFDWPRSYFSLAWSSWNQKFDWPRIQRQCPKGFIGWWRQELTRTPNFFLSWYWNNFINFISMGWQSLVKSFGLGSFAPYACDRWSIWWLFTSFKCPKQEQFHILLVALDD